MGMHEVRPKPSLGACAYEILIVDTIRILGDLSSDQPLSLEYSYDSQLDPRLYLDMNTHHQLWLRSLYQTRNL